jgi:hypothetical protein
MSEASDAYIDVTGKAAEGIARGLLFSAVPLMMLGLSLGVMKLLIRLPVTLVGGE